MSKKKSASIEIQAYKLYIKENWVWLNNMAPEDLKRIDKKWICLCFGKKTKETFDLNETNINKLIEVAKMHGQRFKHDEPVDLKANHGKPLANHGKRLIEGLNDLEHNTSSLSLDSLGALLRLDGIDDFKHSSQFNKFRERAETLSQVDPKKKEAILGVYKGYYLDRDFDNNNKKND